MNAPSSTAEPLATKINTGETVLAKLVRGRVWAYTFANRTQADKAALKAGSGWEVVQRGRPWFVRRAPSKPDVGPWFVQGAREKDARTRTGERTDPVDGFTRTTLIVGLAKAATPNEGGSVDVVTAEGVRLGQINIFVDKDGTFMVDVIDIEKRYKVRRALTFPNGERRCLDAGTIVAAHFEVGS